MRGNRKGDACALVQCSRQRPQAVEERARSSDPQSGDVIDGSVDYYDFDWGDAVFHEERAMEPVLFPCQNSCADACHGGGDSCRPENGAGCSCNGNGGGGNNGGAGTCVDNSPDQNDTNLYEIIQEG